MFTPFLNTFNLACYSEKVIEDVRRPNFVKKKNGFAHSEPETLIFSFVKD